MDFVGCCQSLLIYLMTIGILVGITKFIQRGTATGEKERGSGGPIKIKVINNSTRVIDVELYAATGHIDALCNNEWLYNIAPGGGSKETTFRSCRLGKDIGSSNYLVMDIWTFQVERSQGWLGHFVEVGLPINFGSNCVFTVTDLDATRVKVDRTCTY